MVIQKCMWTFQMGMFLGTSRIALTGDSTERVDTRVLQVIYRVKDQTASLYVGQQMDVCIEAPVERTIRNASLIDTTIVSC